MLRTLWRRLRALLLTPGYPGTTWRAPEVGHCRACGELIHRHGAQPVVARLLGVPLAARHLICKPRRKAA